MNLRYFSLVLLIIGTLVLSACGDSTPANEDVATATPAADVESENAVPTVDIADTESITETTDMTDTMEMTGTEGMTDTMGAASAAADPQGEGIEGANARLIRASEFEGYDVQNPEGEGLGNIQDAVINLSDGRILLVTLEYGGFLDIGDKVFPMPLSAFRFEEITRDMPAVDPIAPAVPDASGVMTDTAVADTTMTDPVVMEAMVVDTRLILDMPQATLEEAPGFEDDFPVLTDPATVGDVEGFYNSLGEDVLGGPVQETDLESIQGTTAKMSDLIGTNVQNPAEEGVGEIDDLLLDIRNGQAVYAILSFGGFLGIGDSQYAIPMENFQILPDPDGGSPMIILDITEAELENVPNFDDIDLYDSSWDTTTRDYWETR